MQKDQLARRAQGARLSRQIQGLAAAVVPVSPNVSADPEKADPISTSEPLRPPSSHSEDKGPGLRFIGRKSGLFTEHRIGLCATGVVLGYAITLVLQLFRPSFIIGTDGKDCLDFTWIWLSSKFASSGALSHAYDYSVFSAARALLVGPPSCILQRLDYPPTLFFFTWPLGLMPYSIAFTTWIGGTLVLYLAAVYTIIPGRVAIIVAVAPYSVFMNVLLGHVGFLPAGLLAWSLALMERRPLLSGLPLGLLTYKPQFGILFPLALLVAREWRVLLSAVAVSMMATAIAAVAFGHEAWPAFIGALADRASSLSADPALNLPLVSVAGFLRVVGLSPKISWIAQLAVTAVVLVTVCVVWSKPIPHSLKAAALAIGALLAAPHAISYDASILAVGVAFLVKDGLERGFLPRERGTMLACWAGLFLLTGPVPAIICVVLLVLVVRRAVRCPFEPAGPRPDLSEPVLAGDADSLLKLTP